MNTILEWQKEHPGETGGEISISMTVLKGNGSGNETMSVQLPGTSAVGLPQLQRMRRQFIALNRQHRLAKSRVRESFVGFLNDGFQ